MLGVKFEKHGVEVPRGLNLLAAVVIAACGLLLYGNTLEIAFRPDDFPHIVYQDALRHLPNWLPLWSSTSSRFLSALTLAMNYAVHGLDVRGYHMVNVAIHITNAILVYFLVRLLWLSEAGRQKSKKGDFGIALLSSLVFLTHPIQTEAVNYIVQRCTCLAAFFYLASMVSYSYWRSGRGWTWYAASLLACAAGMFSKETAFTLPFALGLLEMMFFGGKGRDKKTKLAWIPFILCLMILPAIFGIPTSSSPILSVLSQEGLFISSKDYYLTQINVLRTYGGLLLFPVRQNFDYDYPVAHHFGEHGMLFSIFLILGLLTVALYFRKRDRLISFGILFSLLALSVELFLPLRDVINEHRLYLPVFGFSIFLSGILCRSMGGLQRSLPVLLVFVAVFSVMTFRRNALWADELLFWNDVIRQSPQKARPYQCLAMFYSRRGSHEKAVNVAQQAVLLSSGDARAQLSLCKVFEAQGDLDREVACYEKYKNMKYSNSSIYRLNLAAVYMKKRETSRAAELLREVIRTAPNERAFLMLGIIFREQGKPDDSLAVLLDGSRLYPFSEKLCNALAIGFGEKGDVEKAIDYATRAIKLNPHNAEAHNNLGVAYGFKREPDRAIACFLRALHEDPHYHQAYYNLGIAHRRNGDASKSEEYFRKAEQLRNDFPQQICPLSQSKEKALV